MILIPKKNYLKINLPLLVLWFLTRNFNLVISSLPLRYPTVSMILWWRWIKILQVIHNGSFFLYLICSLLNSTLLISSILQKMTRFSTTVCNLLSTLLFRHKELNMSSKFGNVWGFKYLIKKDHYLDKVAIENFTIDYHSRSYQNIQVISYSSLTHILIL